MACLGGSLVLSGLQSCAGSKIISGEIVEDDLVIPISAFENLTSSQKKSRNYILVHQNRLQYPIYIYKHSDTEYSAVWMRCTHQGTELTAFGEKLLCSAHGSEFDKNGVVSNGPADQNLRSFPIKLENHHIKISLRAV